MAAAPPRRPLLALARLASRATGRERRVRGFVDALVGGHTVVGWAQDQGDPDRRLEIQMLRGHEIVAFGVADLPRKDLAEKRIGDGRYGFRLRVPAALLDGSPHPVRLLAVTERGKTPLQRGEVTIAPPPEMSPGLAPKPSTLVGALERLSDRTLHGWAYNPDQPDAPALVDLFDDEQYLGSVLADRSRPRLYEKGFPSGARGFVFEVPAEGPPPATRRLRGRVAGTSYDLKPTRDYEEEAAQEQEGAPPVPDAVPKTPSLAADPVEQRRTPLAADDMPIALWLAGHAGDAAATLSDWTAQTVPVRWVNTGSDLVGVDARQVPDRQFSGPDPLPVAARAGAWLLLAPHGARLDPAMAGTLAGLPGYPDVVILGGEPSLPDESARLATWLSPDRPGIFAVRADVALDYPGRLADEMATGRLWPLRAWLAERTDLRWARLPCPDPGDPTEAPDPAYRLPAEWRWVDGHLTPSRAPTRLSLGLWAGWDEPGVPALAALVRAAGTGSLDLLVPSGGDEAIGRDRLALAEALLAEGAWPAARARLVDSGADAAATISSLLLAADGDVVLLSDGAACPDAATLTRMAAWALHPQAGTVGLATDNWTTAAQLDRGEIRPVPWGRASAPATFCGFGLLAVATQRVAATGGPAAGALASEKAMLWGLCLQAHGWQSIVLRGEAQGRPPLGFVSGPLPWPIQAAARAAGLRP